MFPATALDKTSTMKLPSLFLSAMLAFAVLSCILVDQGTMLVSAHHHQNNNIMELLAAGLVVKLLQEMNHHHHGKK
ncbi:hypothetical protein JTE90_001376 [Oedothorax gibbosus]|uniref:Uncharacterized protein n=1 Tax=Oedothorax gibbosus TaxID=931172 RepID=A0AAV6VF65_9ARAC|nr:hypothetical protein JTE90_001376 [Oedothorax gibbosus]